MRLNKLKLFNVNNSNKNIICFVVFFIIIFNLICLILFINYLEIKIFLLLISFLFFLTLIAINNCCKNELIKLNNRKWKNVLDKEKERYEKQIIKLKYQHLKELKNFQKLADFGKISIELFHELSNPLTAINLSIEEIKSEMFNIPSLKRFKNNINKANISSKRIAQTISCVKKQLNNNGVKKMFSINKEIEDVIEILKFKAQKKKVEMLFLANNNIKIYGNSTYLYRACLNIISNAIDSYQVYNPYLFSQKLNKKRLIIINIEKKEKIIITIKDFGKGIKNGYLNKIFNPFFSTKKLNQGSGLGLYLSKKLLKEEFNGNITVNSKYGEGSTFKLII